MQAYELHDFSEKSNAKRKYREAIFEAFDYKCAYCGVDGAATLDHIKPRFSGGQSLTSNLISCCSKCNTSKDNENVETWYKRQAFYSLNRHHTIKDWINGITSNDIDDDLMVNL